MPTNLVYPLQLPIPGRHLPPTPPIGPGGTCEEAGLKPLRLNCDRRLDLMEADADIDTSSAPRLSCLDS